MTKPYNVYTPRQLEKWDIAVQMPDGRYIPARPLRFQSWINDLKLAWYVFVGRYDALDWEDSK